jgi:hypothetical protein
VAGERTERKDQWRGEVIAALNVRVRATTSGAERERKRKSGFSVIKVYDRLCGNPKI